MDDASGLQSSLNYGTAFIENPIRQHDNYAVSDFDIRHIVNINAVWQLPVGRGQAFLSHLPKAAEGVLGGWQLTSIFRYNSGLPVLGGPFDAGAWATNFEVQSDTVRIRPVTTHIGDDPNGHPNLFTDPTAAYQSFRSALPGETGDRNIFRYPGYITLDMGLDKTFTMPWSENHRLQFRAEVFNVTNTQRLKGPISDLSMNTDPFAGAPSSTFGVLTHVQGSPRVMQFGLRYEF
jgi:hypothetical protein